MAADAVRSLARWRRLLRTACSISDQIGPIAIMRMLKSGQNVAKLLTNQREERQKKLDDLTRDAEALRAQLEKSEQAVRSAKAAAEAAGKRVQRDAEEQRQLVGFKRTRDVELDRILNEYKAGREGAVTFDTADLAEALRAQFSVFPEERRASSRVSGPGESSMD